MRKTPVRSGREPEPIPLPLTRRPWFWLALGTALLFPVLLVGCLGAVLLGLGLLGGGESGAFSGVHPDEEAIACHPWWARTRNGPVVTGQKVHAVVDAIAALQVEYNLSPGGGVPILTVGRDASVGKTRIPEDGSGGEGTICADNPFGIGPDIMFLPGHAGCRNFVSREEARRMLKARLDELQKRDIEGDPLRKVAGQ